MSLPSRSVVRFYNKRGTAEQWIKQGKQATHGTRKAVVSSVPGQRSAAATERAGLQPGQLVAAARTAEQDQELVADELATQVDEDRRSPGQARAVLLAAAGRRAFEPQVVRRHAAQDLGAAAAKRVALTGRGSNSFRLQKVSQGAVSAKSPPASRNAAIERHSATETGANGASIVRGERRPCTRAADWSTLTVAGWPKRKSRPRGVATSFSANQIVVQPLAG